MAELYRNANVARSVALAPGLQTIDADIADTQVDPEAGPQPVGTHGPLYRVVETPVRWATIPSSGTEPEATPVDAAGMLLDVVAVQRHLDGSGQLLGHSRDPSTAELNGGTLVASQFFWTDANLVPGDLVYLTVLSVNNVGSVPAIRIVAVNGLTPVVLP
jgi:hypothetical protein